MFPLRTQFAYDRQAGPGNSWARRLQDPQPPSPGWPTPCRHTGTPPWPTTGPASRPCSRPTSGGVLSASPPWTPGTTKARFRRGTAARPIGHDLAPRAQDDRALPITARLPGSGHRDARETGPPHGANGLTALIGPTRAAILTTLTEPTTTTVLAGRHSVTPGAVSQHLSVLRSAGLVVSWRQGHSVLYHRTRSGDHLLKTAE